MRIKTILIKGLLSLLFTLASCGYQFEGGGYLNETVKRVAVELFSNRSGEEEADVMFTNALIQEIIDRSDTMVSDSDDSVHVLQSEIKSIVFDTLSRSSTETVVERRVTAVIDVKLIGPDGKVVWSVKDFSTDDDYTVSEDQISDSENKQEAVERIAERIAEKLVSRMVTNF